MSTEFEDDWKETAEVVKEVSKHTTSSKIGIIRHFVDEIASHKSVEYREDLFSAVRKAV